jgi:hypothetical protein
MAVQPFSPSDCRLPCYITFSLVISLTDHKVSYNMMNCRRICPYLWFVRRSYLNFIGNDGILKFYNARLVTKATVAGLFIFFCCHDYVATPAISVAKQLASRTLLLSPTYNLCGLHICMSILCFHALVSRSALCILHCVCNFVIVFVIFVLCIVLSVYLLFFVFCVLYSIVCLYCSTTATEYIPTCSYYYYYYYY